MPEPGLTGSKESCDTWWLVERSEHDRDAFVLAQMSDCLNAYTDGISTHAAISSPPSRQTYRFL